MLQIFSPSILGGPNISGGGDGDPQGDEEASDLGETQVHREVQLRQLLQGGPCGRRRPSGCFKNCSLDAITQ